MNLTPITYEALAAAGFVRLQRIENQPHDQMQRAIATECIGDKFMVAAEDLCITMAPTAAAAHCWFCWVSKAHAFQRNPHVWIHVRQLWAMEEVARLYEGLTGRAFASGKWVGPLQRDLGERLFDIPECRPQRELRPQGPKV